MGLNICAYNITVTDLVRKGNSLHAERYEGFDSCRYTGDRDFIDSDNIKWLPHPEGGLDFEEEYYRPENIQQAREWVIGSNIFEGNKPRLLKLLDDMEADPTLYIYCSF